jgi:hypothetical protein
MNREKSEKKKHFGKKGFHYDKMSKGKFGHEKIQEQKRQKKSKVGFCSKELINATKRLQTHTRASFGPVKASSF